MSMMPSSSRPRILARGGPDRARGQVLVVFALFLVVLLGASALTIDYGTWLKARRDYQNVVDPAALAGSFYLTRPTSAAERTLARRAAWNELNRQLGLGMTNGQLVSAANGSTGEAGHTPPGTDYKAWVASPPMDAGAAYPGAITSATSRTVFVRVERDNPAFLSRTMGFGDRRVSAWATAGVFPNRYAVITLRQQGQAPGNVGENIFIGGSTSRLEVVNGDVGGNWNMKLNSGAQLWVRGATGMGNDAETYLKDYVSCGNSCWSSGQINSGPNGSPPNEVKTAMRLPGLIDDPNYPLPPALVLAPNGPVAPAVPVGDDGDGAGGNQPGNIDAKSGGPDEAAPRGVSTFVDGTGVRQCPAGSAKIGPGYYTGITVRAGKCLILDPTMRHTNIRASGPPDVATPVLGDQNPGIFYINGDVNIETNAMLVGDGVTLIIRPGVNNKLVVSGGGIVDINRGVTGTTRRLGAWTSLGAPTYVPDGAGIWQYNSAMESNVRNVGIAIYVIKRSQYSSVADDNNSSVLVTGSGAGIAWRGITYAPHDNVTLEGQPGHDGVGQLISWTFKFAGGTTVKQEYEGQEDGTPFLLEPRTGQ